MIGFDGRYRCDDYDGAPVHSESPETVYPHDTITDPCHSCRLVNQEACDCPECVALWDLHTMISEGVER